MFIINKLKYSISIQNHIGDDDDDDLCSCAEKNGNK